MTELPLELPFKSHRVTVDCGMTGERLPYESSVRNAAAMARARQRDRIGIREEAALSIPDGVQSANGLVISRKNLGVLIDTQAVGHGKQPRRDVASVERGVLYRAEEALGHAKVRVLAGLAEAVVTIDGFLQGLGRDPDFARQLLERVGLDERPALNLGRDAPLKPVQEGLRFYGFLPLDTSPTVFMRAFVTMGS